MKIQPFFFIWEFTVLLIGFPKFLICLSYHLPGAQEEMPSCLGFHVEIQLFCQALLKDCSFLHWMVLARYQSQRKWPYGYISRLTIVFHCFLSLGWSFNMMPQSSRFYSLASTCSRVVLWSVLRICHLAWVGYWHPLLRCEGHMKGVHMTRSIVLIISNRIQETGGQMRPRCLAQVKEFKSHWLQGGCNPIRPSQHLQMHLNCVYQALFWYTQ